VFGVTPGKHVEALRLDAARDHLIASAASIARVAHSVGFNSEDAFRRAFDRCYGVSPSEFRQRFTPTLSRAEQNRAGVAA